MGWGLFMGGEASRDRMAPCAFTTISHRGGRCSRAPDDYAEEAAFFGRHLKEACDGPARTLLELGSGGGNNASHMKRLFEQVTLVDISQGMLDVAAA